MEEIRFDVTIDVMDMYKFMMRHAYVGLPGAVNIIISGGAFVLLLTGTGKGDAFATAMLLLISALFTIINPIFILYKSAKQVKFNKMFEKPFTYVVNGGGIKVSQGTEELLIEWEHIRKAVETKNYIYIYLSLTRAFIFPKAMYREYVEGFKDLIRGNTRIRMK